MARQKLVDQEVEVAAVGPGGLTVTSRKKKEEQLESEKDHASKGSSVEK